MTGWKSLLMLIIAGAWMLTGHDEHDGDTLPSDTRPEPMRIDHCFVSADLAPGLRNMHIDDTSCGSDHQPIFVTLNT